jgi:hypothetical protein
VHFIFDSIFLPRAGERFGPQVSQVRWVTAELERDKMVNLIRRMPMTFAIYSTAMAAVDAVSFIRRIR